MTYEQTIEYLFTRLPMFSRIGAAAFKKDITNTIRLCQAIGNPQDAFKSVHIAGTNGKGSTSHMLAAIFQTAGYKTGLYTSPHLHDFRERIKINGDMITREFVTAFVEENQSLIEDIEPSFFEITVAMAFKYFAQEQVDIAIVEVGLGGRFDSTNIIIPELSVITNISFDHMNLLGDTLEKIAFEKAGIIKPGVPVVVGESDIRTNEVFESKAAGLNCHLYFADRHIFIADWEISPHLLTVEATSSRNNEKTRYQLDLNGIYQIKNVVTVLQAVHLLQEKGWKISASHIHKALMMVRKLTGLHGRWEIIQEHPLVVLDVGHNEAGIRQLMRQIEITDHLELHIVLGMVKDKEVETILSLLPKHAHYYFTKAQIPRALPEEQLQKMAALCGLQGNAYQEVNQAVRAALSTAGKKDLLVICGSLFVVGEVNLALVQ